MRYYDGLCHAKRHLSPDHRHIPDPGNHCQRFYGAYSNRGRVASARARGDGGADTPAHEDGVNADVSREARSTWARLMRKIFEADPLLCTCGARMRIVSFITDLRVVHRILRHRQGDRCSTGDPFESRDPPLSRPQTLRQVCIDNPSAGP